MLRKILRWIFGLPLLVGGAVGFVLGLINSSAAVIPAAIAMAFGALLLAPRSALEGTGADAAEGDGPHTLAWSQRNANPELFGTGAWHARRMADSCETSTQAWYRNNLTGH